MPKTFRGRREIRCATSESENASKNLVFFALIGGVPNELLHFDPNDPDKSKLTDADWVKIIGKDPDNYNLEGIDPHMLQSTEPRPGLTGADKPLGDNGDDPIHGREWKTNKKDLQYACTFALKQERDCRKNNNSCDCGPDNATENKNPPLCNGTKQVRAKAYPTTRQLRVVRGLKKQGIVGSLCPQQLTDSSDNNLTYGYRPAVVNIINRLKEALTTACLPQKLREDSAEPGPVPCLVLAELGEAGQTCAQFGLREPAPDIVKIFLEEQRKERAASGNTDAANTLPVCEVPQEAVARGATCKASPNIAWCYVENTGSSSGKGPAGRCPQALLFSTKSQELKGAQFYLQCIRQTASE